MVVVDAGRAHPKVHLAVNRLVHPDQAWEQAVANSKTLWDSYLQPARLEKYKAFRDDYVKYLVEVQHYQEKMQAYYTQMAVRK